MNGKERIRELLRRLYGEAKGRTAARRILTCIENFPRTTTESAAFFSERDAVLITYGDTLTSEGEAPLVTLHGFAKRYLTDAVSTIHFLPFFPSSSDDGFSVTDFFAINPALGSWDDVARFGNDFRLMFDFVLNHISAKSPWFRRYLQGREGFRHLAIAVDPATDLSMVTRPRSLPILTAVSKDDGTRVHLWTTFSPDQIDLNYADIDTLEKMVQVLLFYVRQGATLLRLDAIAYLWKAIGTSCIHAPQTHDMVKLFRAILDTVGPAVGIITETNVPHQENISYFGNGHNEAQMVYNFTLPPLLLHTFLSADTTVLSQWARGLRLESERTTFFNFTASHDGIGVRPLEGILPPENIRMLIELVARNGGRVSYKRNPDGSESPYELNITYIDAILADPASNRADRFLASQAIQYALPGVPATYVHSLLGSRNWQAGVRETGRARSINREKLRLSDVTAELSDRGSFRSSVFFPYHHLISIRRRQKAFHPNAAFEILTIDPRVFALRRDNDGQVLYALTNVSSSPVSVSVPGTDVPERMTDVLTGEDFTTQSLELRPYQYVWLSYTP